MKTNLIKIGVIVFTILVLYYLYTTTNNIEQFKSSKSTLKNKVNINSEEIEKLKQKLINAQTQLTEIEKKQKKMDNMVKKGQKMGNKIKNRNKNKNRECEIRNKK